MESSEEESVDGPDVQGACCGSLRGSSNAQAFEPSDRRYVVRSMALMLPSLTQHGKPPGALAPVHSHTEVPGGTWHMNITYPTVDRSQQTARRQRARSSKKPPLFKRQLLRVRSATWRLPSQSSTPWPSTYSLGERIAVVQFAGFDRRSDDGAVLGAAVGACEERIFPAMVRSTGLLSSSIQPSSKCASVLSARERIADRVGELALLTDQTKLCS
jgi:hypothetical protein